MRITVTEASEKLGLSALSLRCAMQQGKFKVFGEAFKNGDSQKWTYYINRNRFEMYLKGELNNENNQPN